MVAHGRATVDLEFPATMAGVFLSTQWLHDKEQHAWGDTFMRNMDHFDHMLSFDHESWIVTTGIWIWKSVSEKFLLVGVHAMH